MLVGRRGHGLWLVIAVAVVLLGCLVAAWYLQYHRQMYPQHPLHEQTRLTGEGAPLAGT
jgi:hypothetical protein